MRIALIVPGFSAHPDDWCIPALRHFVERLARTNEVHVLALRYPFSAGRYRVFGAEVTALSGGKQQGWGSARVWGDGLRTLARRHRRHPFDVMHAFWANETGALTAFAGRVLGIATVVSLAGGELVALRDIAYGGQIAPTERLKVRLALRLADAVTAGSESLLQRAAAWLRARPSEQVQRIPLGVDLDLFQPRVIPAMPGPPRLVHVASLIPVKDQVTLLRAADRLRRQGLQFRLEIAGEGPLGRSLHALVDRLGLRDMVAFRGPLPHPELSALYNTGAAFVLTSRYEAQSMVVLEAAACGLPVVGTSVGVLPEMAPEAAVVVPVGDATALAAALARLLNDPARQDAMARAGLRCVSEEFSLERCVTRFEDLYATLVGTSRQRR